jgi:hypothetical protein
MKLSHVFTRNWLQCVCVTSHGGAHVSGVCCGAECICVQIHAVLRSVLGTKQTHTKISESSRSLAPYKQRETVQFWSCSLQMSTAVRVPTRLVLFGVFYCYLSILFNTVIYVFLLYSYCMFMYFHRASWHSSATLTEFFPCFFLSCKTNARVKLAKTGHGPHSFKTFVLFYVLFVLCRSVYCL